MKDKVNNVKKLNEQMEANGKYATMLVTSMPKKMMETITNRIEIMKDIERLIKEYNELDEQIVALYNGNIEGINLDVLEDRMSRLVSRSERVMIDIVDIRGRSVEYFN